MGQHAPGRWHRVALLAIVPIVAFVVHARALGGGFTNWDDPAHLLRNQQTVDPLVAGPTDLLLTPTLGYAIPVTVLGYAAQRAIAGHQLPGHDPEDARIYHGVSLGLHACVALIFALLALRLGARIEAAVLATCVVAAHPLAVEPVAWVSGQKDLWAALFVGLALLVRAHPRGSSPARAVLVVVLATLAIGSKPSAVAVAGLVVVVDWALGRSLRSRGNLLVYGVVAVIAALAVAVAIGGHSLTADSRARFGGADSLWSLALALSHIFVPSDLSARYYPPTGAEYVVFVVLGAIATIGIVVLVTRLGSKSRAMTFGAIAALVAYAPASQIVRIHRGHADSYLYLPMLLLAVSLAAGLTRAWHRSLAAALAVTVLVCALLSWDRAEVWSSGVTLWADVMGSYPDEPDPQIRYGDALLFEGRVREAVEVFDEVWTEHPEEIRVAIDYGLALEAVGRIDDAERVFAAGARRGDTEAYRSTYALFLVGRGLEPSDPEIAEKALVETAPVLIERGKRASSVHRAADLLERYGHPDLATELRGRLRTLEAQPRH